MTPGRNCSTRTSAAVINGCRRVSASAAFRSIEMLRLPRLSMANGTLVSAKRGGWLRISSPLSGRSILITSAPASARSKVAIGPGSRVLKSRMRMPARGCMQEAPGDERCSKEHRWARPPQFGFGRDSTRCPGVKPKPGGCGPQVSGQADEIGGWRAPTRARSHGMLVQNAQETDAANKPDNAPRALHLSLEDIWNGIAQDQFLPHYQPKVTLKGMELVGVEALMRWNHPEHGLLSAGTFLALVADNFLFDDLTAIMLEKSIGQSHRWQNH